MISEKSKNLIKEEMLNLPKEVQDAINSLDWESIAEQIGKKYLLDENEINTFQLETASFILGLVDEDLYPRNIEDEVGTSRAEAEKIAREVEEKIFKPIYDTMIENIKNSQKSKSSTAEQNLNFILSGGDYSAFVEETTPTNGTIQEEKQPKKTEDLPFRPKFSAPPTLESVKANMEKNNATPVVKKMTDIKTKFTI